MTQQGLFSLFLFLHVLGAIVAFGPALVLGVIASFAAGEPQHRHYTTRLGYFLSTRVVIPVGLTLPITGALMIWTAQIDLSAPQNRWLGLGIILYVIAILYAIFVQVPSVKQLIDLTSAGAPGGGPPAGGPPAGGQLPGTAGALEGGPPAGAPAGPAAASAGPPAGAPAGPPPHIAAAIRKVQRGGILLTVLIVSIVLLMVVKPQF